MHKWLGIHLQDVMDFVLQKNDFHKSSTNGILELTLRDRRLISSFQDESQTKNEDDVMLLELLSMYKFGYKAEIESLISLSNVNLKFTDILKKIILTPSQCRQHFRIQNFNKVNVGEKIDAPFV